MKKITNLIAVLTLATMVYAQCDVNGNYRVTALDVQYYDIARQQTEVKVSDAYGQGFEIVLQTINAGDLFYATHSGPYNSAILDQIGVNLNVNFNEDCTASLAAGSYYPDVNEENCISSVQVLPITDDMTFTSNQSATGQSPLPTTNLIGLPSISARAYAGGTYGGLSLDEALIFDYFPQGGMGYMNQVGPDFTPFTGDEYGPVTIPIQVNYPTGDVYPANTPLPGIHGGWITIGDVGPSQIGGGDSGVPLNETTPSGFAEWHAIDGEASQSGFGDFIGNDEDGFDGDLDRTFGLPVIPSATYFTNAPGCSAAGAWAEDLGTMPVAGDVTGNITGAVEAGCYGSVVAGITAQCDAYGISAMVEGSCIEQVNSDETAATCEAVGVYATLNGFCLALGADAATCDYVATGLVTASGDDCATALYIAGMEDDPNGGVTLCETAGGIADGMFASDCSAFAGNFSTEALDDAALGLTGATCPQTAAGWAGLCIAGVDIATDVWVMSPDALYAPWSQFVTWNAIAFGSAIIECVTADQAGIGACVEGAVPGCMADGTSYDECVASSTADCIDASTAVCTGAVASSPTGQYLLATNDSGTAFDPSCLADGDPSDCGGRWAFHFTPTCIPEIEVRQIVIEFNELGGECANNGDANEDGNTNVLDVVGTVAHILGNGTLTDGGACNADSNADGTLNVLDVVLTVNTILGNARSADATSIEINKSANEVTFDANGYVGAIQMTLSHGEDFSISLTSDALIADANTEDNKTTLIIVNPGTTDLFTAVGGFAINEVLASSDGYNYINADVNMPISYTISDAYPNPFNPTTSIDIALDTDANVSVKVFNIMGQLVDVISEGNLTAGSHAVVWDASQISSGVYFINSEIGSEVNVQKIMLVK